LGLPTSDVPKLKVNEGCWEGVEGGTIASTASAIGSTAGAAAAAITGSAASAADAADAAAVAADVAAAACCTRRVPVVREIGTGDPTPRGVVRLSMFEIAAARAPSPDAAPAPVPEIAAVAQFHADPKVETAGAGPPRNEKNQATNQFRMAASIPKALVGMCRTCKFSKSDTNPAKIAISGRNTPRKTMSVETPESTLAAVSIIVQ